MKHCILWRKVFLSHWLTPSTQFMYFYLCLFSSTIKLKSSFQSINKLKNPTHLLIRFTWFELNWRVGQGTSLIFGHVIQNPLRLYWNEICNKSTNIAIKIYVCEGSSLRKDLHSFVHCINQVFLIGCSCSFFFGYNPRLGKIGGGSKGEFCCWLHRAFFNNMPSAVHSLYGRVDHHQFSDSHVVVCCKTTHNVHEWKIEMQLCPLNWIYIYTSSWIILDW